MIVFLLEESSMKEFLCAYLPKVFPGLEFLCIKHEGKSDLEKSIPRKLRALKNDSFVVVRDNDGADCRQVKKRLNKLCADGGRPDSLVRIACQELESWYLGSPETLAEVYGKPKLKGLGRKAKYRDPDALGCPSDEVLALVPEFNKNDGARRMGAAMPLAETDNRSHSFQVFVRGIRQIA